jgi:site-specific recombinase XerD
MGECLNVVRIHGRSVFGSRRITVYDRREQKTIRQSTKCRDKQAAETFARQLERDLSDPAHAAAQAPTRDDVLTSFIAWYEEQARAERRSEDTALFYRKKSGHLLRLFGRDFRVATLTNAGPIDNYISKRRSEDVQDSTIAKELVCLRAALKLAKRRGKWRGDIGAIMPVAFAPQYEPRTRALSRKEVEALLAQLTPDRAARVAFMIATSANLRESERARRDHVAADYKEVMIDGTKRSTRRRVVPIVTADQRSLIEYAVEHAEGAGGMLFRDWPNMWRDLNAACDRAGISHCSSNDLRRTCATWLRIEGAPVELLAPVMGHVDSTMVERVYGRLTSDQLRERLARAVHCVDFVPNTDCADFVPNSVDGTTLRRPSRQNRARKAERSRGNSMGPGGVEPPTLGLESPLPTWPKPREFKRKTRRRDEVVPILYRSKAGEP